MIQAFSLVERTFAPRSRALPFAGMNDAFGVIAHRNREPQTQNPMTSDL